MKIQVTIVPNVSDRQNKETQRDLSYDFPLANYPGIFLYMCNCVCVCVCVCFMIFLPIVCLKNSFSGLLYHRCALSYGIHDENERLKTVSFVCLFACFTISFVLICLFVCFKYRLVCFYYCICYFYFVSFGCLLSM